MNLNVPDAPNKRIVIVGAGFGGLTLAKDLLDTGLQIVRNRLRDDVQHTK